MYVFITGDILGVNVSNDQRFLKTFLILATTTIAVVVVSVFVSFHLRTERLTQEILLQQGRTLFSQLIMTRRWISDHGGVYVKVRPGVDPDPFLTTLPHLKVNLHDDGSVYTLRNPGLVVRGISEMSEESGLFRFRVTSLDPINKKTNTPGPFEKEALASFENGKAEVYAVEESGQGPQYRYMAPLVFEEKCNKCHAFQKHKIGDILGGISISIPMETINEMLKVNRVYTGSTALIVLMLFLFSFFVLARKFRKKLNDSQAQLVVMATIDSLTKLFNRKVGLERLDEEISKHIRLKKSLSCLMLDIDHFKSINDIHGHLAGDAVLQALAGTITKFSRKYDVSCRYGGEEFLIVLPETDLDAAVKVGEKLRIKILETPIVFNGSVIKITASIGVAQLDKDVEESVEHLINKADTALYKAKKQGRNQVVAQTL